MDEKPRLALEPTVWFFSGQRCESEPVRRVPILSTPFRVGRRQDLQLTLPCPCVSKEHAEIVEHDRHLWVRDLGSTNGTYLNGERLTGEAMLQDGDIIQFATVIFRVGRAPVNPNEYHTVTEDACDKALSLMQFDRLLDGRAIVPFYQPIVDVSRLDLPLTGYEVLGRSRIFGLQTPKQMFSAASQLNLENELSRAFRRRGVEVAQQHAVEDRLYVNTHPAELNEPDLIESLHELRSVRPHLPITLEIHEASVTNREMIRSLRDALTDLDIGLAFDDFGAGQARLVELSEARPDCVKFDMSLVQGIHHAPPSRQEVLALLIKMVNDLGIASLAEGVETWEDHETLAAMGVRLGQGFIYGRPASIKSFSP